MSCTPKSGSREWDLEEDELLLPDVFIEKDEMS